MRVMHVEWATMRANPKDYGDCIGKDGGVMVEQFSPKRWSERCVQPKADCVRNEIRHAEALSSRIRCLCSSASRLSNNKHHGTTSVWWDMFGTRG